MSGFIPEITTTINVRVNPALEECISTLESCNVEGCFTELLSTLQTKQDELKQVQDPIAELVAQDLQSNQEQYIRARHNRSGMMANSVDITHDGDGTYLVGNTAMSVDGFPYPLAIETGRREVYPINAKLLRWVDNGEVIFAKRSRSVAPDPFEEPSIEMTRANVEGIINNYLSSIFN